MAYPKGGPKVGGRKKGTPNKATADIKALAQEHAAEAIAKLVSILRTTDSDATRVSAIKELLDRGYGKPSQAITGEGGGPLRSVTRIENVIVDPKLADR
jgi:hypothetical protein